ncbi:MAG: hypothetical protein WD423_08925 [Rhodothermales bacterium]
MRRSFCLRLAVPAFLALSLSACDVFSPRSPEHPIEDVGTFVQPDTPDQVVDNIRTAVAELNARNYRRSFADDLTFTPTTDASARDPSVWTGWSAQEEESYFLALAEAARLTADNELGLSDVEQTAGAARFTIDASYTLRVNHRRADLPTTLQGRLVWTIDQGEDGLWRVTSWTDRTVGDAASWSDLKAAFIK